MEVCGVSSKGLSRTAAVVAALTVAVGMAAMASAGMGATPNKKHVPLCRLGQVTTKAKPCLKNPAFAGRACDAYNDAVSALVGSPALAGQNRAGGPGIACFFKVAGQTQQFQFHAYRKVPSHTRDTTAQAAYDFMWQEALDTVAQNTPESPGCYVIVDGRLSKSWSMNAPQLLTGLGDKAFAWDQCTPRSYQDFTQVFVLKGDALYSAVANHPSTTATVDQLVAFVRQLMKTYP